MIKVTGSLQPANFTYTNEEIKESKNFSSSKILKTLNQSLSSLNEFSKFVKSNPVKCSGLAIGVTLGCYGAYRFILGMENLKPNQEDAIHMASAGDYLDYQGAESCEARLEEAKKTLFSCPTAKKLWDEVEKEGAFKVKCPTNQAEEPATGASVVVNTRTITISGKNKHMVSPLLFELSNLKRAKMFSGIQNGKCSLQRDLYAISIEAIEYETVKENYDISSGCVNEGYWPKELRRFDRFFNQPSEENDWSNFPNYLKFQEKNVHTDLYRRDWYLKCDLKGFKEWYETNLPKWQAASQVK